MKKFSSSSKGPDNISCILNRKSDEVFMQMLYESLQYITTKCLNIIHSLTVFNLFALCLFSDDCFALLLMRIQSL